MKKLGRFGQYAAFICGSAYDSFWALESTWNGYTYHWASVKDKMPPPILKKITRLEWYDSGIILHDQYDQNGEPVTQKWGRYVTIWKRGWHHIKGARKIARSRRKYSEEFFAEWT